MNLDARKIIEYDKRGLLAGANESVEEYFARIGKLRTNTEKMESALAKSGSYDVEDGLRVSSKDRIKQNFFANANGICTSLYGFAADWVPAFFIDPSCSLLFGGCSYSFLPDFFALFIIRRSFKKKARWLIYDRDELLAHELCHVARAALSSDIYEETFAYQTSPSAFRRLAGGLFLRQLDSFLLLGSTFVLLLAQISRVYFFPSLPIVAFWMLPALVLCWLVLRYTALRRRMSRALNTLHSEYGDNAMQVLFRCDDAEIDVLSTGNMPSSLTSQDTARFFVLENLKNKPQEKSAC